MSALLRNLSRFVRKTPLAPVARLLWRTFKKSSRGQVYDAQTIEVLKRVLERDSICIDVGAHRGAILKEMVTIAPNGTHFAFEPIPEFAEALRVAFPTVHVYECALARQQGTSSFEYVVNAPAYSGLRPREYDRPDPQVARITVSTDTLDNIVPRNLRVAFVKIDVEGGEYDVLVGGIDTIRRCRPVIVFEASKRSTGMYGVAADDVFTLIADEAGMKLSTMDRWLRGAEALSAYDFRRSWSEGTDFYFIAYDELSTKGRKPGSR